MFSTEIARRAAAAVLLLLSVSAQAEAQPVPLLGNGSLPSSQLIVGDDLWVGLKGGEAGAEYDFRLVGADGSLISGAYATADAAGAVASTLVWKRSGVVGCDCGAAPGDYRFQTYEQAEAALSGKTLVLQVLTLSGVQVARVAVPAIAMRRELSYFSDAAGCPRQIFKAGEAIHLSFLHPDRSRGDRQVFIAQSKLWPIGEPIRDLRGGGQKMTLPLAGDRVTLPLAGLSLSVPGSYDGIVRKEAVLDPIRLGPDFVLGNPSFSPITCWEGSGGIVITQDGCPNCGGPNYP